MFMDAENNSFENSLNYIFKLENLRIQNPKNVTFSYLNINSVHNKFSGLTNLVCEHDDNLIVVETKLDTSFPTAEFLIPGFHKPLRFDVTANCRGLSVYVRGCLPARELQAYKLPFDIQAIPLEINLRKEKWLFIGIYKPPSQNSQYFLNI